jgi:hypothetical protein
MKTGSWIAGAWVLFLAGCGPGGTPVPADIANLSQERPLGDETGLEADIRFDLGTVEITREAEALYSLDLEYDRSRYDPRVEYAPGAKGRLSCRLENRHEGGIRREHSNRLRLGFADSVPLDLHLASGVGETRLSLSGIRLESLDMESGVGAVKISAYEPNPIRCDEVRFRSGVGSLEAVGLANLNFSVLRFEGGVGGATLDFSGEWRQDADIHIEVGVGGVDLRFPREAGVRVDAAKNFLSGVQLEGFSLRDGAWYSENYDRAAVKVNVKAATGVGGLKVGWI